MNAISAGLQWFVDLGASVMLPVLLFIFALILQIKPGKAFKAGLTVGIGFVGLNLVIDQEPGPSFSCHGAQLRFTPFYFGYWLACRFSRCLRYGSW